MMDVFEAIRTRRSVRKYRPEPIPNDKLEMIFEAARLAPSAGNRQPWRFVVIRDADRKKALAEAANNQSFLSELPQSLLQSVILRCRQGGMKKTR